MNFQMNFNSKYELKKYFYGELRTWQGFLLFGMTLFLIFSNAIDIQQRFKANLPYEFHFLTLLLEIMLLLGTCLDSLPLMLPYMIFKSWFLTHLYEHFAAFVSSALESASTNLGTQDALRDAIMTKTFILFCNLYYIKTMYMYVYYHAKIEYWNLNQKYASLPAPTPNKV